jgi:hypothetical protein
MAVCQNLVPLVNIKIAGKWMFIPLKMVLIGIDPYPYHYFLIPKSSSQIHPVSIHFLATKPPRWSRYAKRLRASGATRAVTGVVLVGCVPAVLSCTRRAWYLKIVG